MQSNVPRDGRIRVMLVDDHQLVLSGIRQFLSTQSHIDIVGEASDGEEAIAQAKMLRPDVILMDISMPNMNGIEATREITRTLPAVKVILLTMHDEREYLKQFINCGAHGYVMKKTSPTELILAIEAVHRGEAFLSTLATQILMDNVRNEGKPEEDVFTKNLSAKELQILVLIAQGMSTKMIADHITMPIRTVEKHRQNVMDKLDLHTVVGLTSYAISNGLVRPR